MKKYTVTARCKHVNTKYTLRHNGEKWTDQFCDETTFASREEAEVFAAQESESFEVLHEMVINEFNDAEEDEA
jgi:hypothetical protein